MYQNIDELISIKVGYGITTLSGASNLVTGSAVNRVGYESGTIAVLLSSATGTPTSGLVTITVQDSNDGSTFSNTDYSFAISTSNTSSKLQEYSIILSGLKSYIRVIANASFVGGTTPTVTTTSVVVLGTSKVYPI